MGYAKINAIRKNVVHYRQLETDFAAKHLEAIHDRKLMQEIQNEKESFPEFYKEQLARTIEGFIHSINLIDEYFIKFNKH